MGLLLIRHAQSLKNLQNQHGSSADDLPLSPAGREHAKMVAKQIFEFGIADYIPRIYASSSRSTHETATILGDIVRRDVITAPSLHAINMGIVSGLPMDVMRSRYPQFHAEIRKYESGLLHPKDFTIEGQEPFEVFEDRITAAITALSLENEPCSFPLLVVHQSVIAMAVNWFLAYPQSAAMGPYAERSVPNLSFSLVDLAALGKTSAVKFAGQNVEAAAEHFLHKNGT